MVSGYLIRGIRPNESFPWYMRKTHAESLPLRRSRSGVRVAVTERAPLLRGGVATSEFHASCSRAVRHADGHQPSSFEAGGRARCELVSALAEAHRGSGRRGARGGRGPAALVATRVPPVDGAR